MLLRKGDRVQMIFQMDKIGTVLEVRSKASHQWLMGGALSSKLFVDIKLDTGDVVTVAHDDLMRED